MNELIRGNVPDCLITMAKLSFFTILGIVIVTLLFISAIPQVTAGLEGFMISQDSNEPDIWEWGIEGEPELGQGFDVWANVSDQDDDLKNVTVQVIGPNMTINNLMTFNGTFYTGFVPAFPNDGTFSVRIRAYDLENNTRTSTLVYIDFESNPTPTIDPSVTMPIVVGSSVGFMVFVVGLALLYDRRTVPDLEGL